MANNLEIAQQAKMGHIDAIAAAAGLSKDDYEPLGRYKAKLTNEGISRLTSSDKGKLVLVTAINPTPAGEGKTTVSIGLAEGLNRLGSRAIPAIREPALGPVFGIKGGACGGGYSQVLPMEDINLFFTGDLPAITTAHNLLAAMMDASIHNGNPLGLDTSKIWWPRALDMIDRALREVVIGLGDGNGPLRTDHFVITAASEIMAVLCLSSSFEDLESRLQRIVVGLQPDNSPVTADDVLACGAMAMVLRDAIRPNLVQTLEGARPLCTAALLATLPTDAHRCLRLGAA